MVDALVESEHGLIQVTIHVVRLYRHIRPVQSTLEKRPEILDCLCVNLTAHIFTHVIHGFVNEALGVESNVAKPAIAVYRTSEAYAVKYWPSVTYPA
jgi:hypothetical protein